MKKLKGTEKQVTFAQDLINRLDQVIGFCEVIDDQETLNYCRCLEMVVKIEGRSWAIIDALKFIRGKDVGQFYESIKDNMRGEYDEIITGFNNGEIV